MFLPMKDPRRQKNCGDLHFASKESRPKPKKRTYDEYLANGTEAIQTKTAVNGVRGIWTFNCLSYAKDIARTVDAMHANNNVVSDILRSIRPTTGGDRQLFKHKNRTTHPSVIEHCTDEGIPTTRNHIFTKAECITADDAMNKVIGITFIVCNNFY